MAEHRVTCVTKPHRDSAHEAIIRLGGPGWSYTRLEVWDRLTREVDRFFTQVNDRRAYLYPRTNANGTKYVQTVADGAWTNNLLNLPECQ